MISVFVLDLLSSIFPISGLVFVLLSSLFELFFSSVAGELGGCSIPNPSPALTWPTFSSTLAGFGLGGGGIAVDFPVSSLRVPPFLLVMDDESLSFNGSTADIVSLLIRC